jgi:hypothetical protein
MMLVDPRDESLPDVGLTTFEDWESDKTLLVNTKDKRVRAHYEKTMRKFRVDRSTFFRKLALDECVVRTDRSFVEPLRQLFARRAKRLRSR